MANVILKNVYKKWDNDFIAVNDFSIDIKSREVIVLVGPSGCGKSNTLYMMAGIEDISEGEMYIDGKLVNNVEPKDRGIAMVFQNYALFPHMTIFENIAFGLQPTDMPEAEIKEKVESISHIMDIVHLLNRKPHELSSGQQQRVALGRALIQNHQDHKVIMLDEPLSNLDAKLRAHMRVELLKLHQKFETTFIYVTHDQDIAMAIADRIVVMRDGAIMQTGTPEELYLHPDNLFVAGFLGTPMMNFCETEVTEQDGGIFVSIRDTKIKLPENKADKASAYIGKKVWAGVRPEDIYVGDAVLSVPRVDKNDVPCINATVEIREFLGNRVYLHFSEYFTVCVSPDCAAKSGDKIKLAINPDKIYLFDKETELAIVN